MTDFDKIACSRGYEIVEVFQDNERTFVAQVLGRSGNQAILKVLVGAEPVQLQREIWFSGMLDRLPRCETQPVRGPEIFEWGRDWYLREFLCGSPLVAEGESHKHDLEQYITPMVEVLLHLDRLRFDSRGGVAYDETIIEAAIVRLENPKPTKENGVPPLGKAAMDCTKAILGKHARYIQRSLQHGDFAPWHFFAKDSQLVLTDAEHAGIRMRYRDLAFLYMRLWTRANSPASAKSLLGEFLGKNNESEQIFFRQFLPVVLLMALAGYHDSYIDWVEHDYKRSSRELLSLCLEGRFNLLA
jgi:hypothetical protein